MDPDCAASSARRAARCWLYQDMGRTFIRMPGAIGGKAERSIDHRCAATAASARGVAHRRRSMKKILTCPAMWRHGPSDPALTRKRSEQGACVGVCP